MTLRLHWSPDSANIVVRIALQELRLGFEPVRVDRAAGEHKQPAYLRLNPQGLLPVLEDGDLVLFETGAILLHLADRTGRLGPEGPDAREPQARAAFLKWLFYLSNTVHADLRAGFYAPRYVAGEAAVPALRAGLAARIHRHMELLASELGADGWLVAGTPTLADFYLAACLRWAQLYPSAAPLIVPAEIPAGLHALLRATETREAVARAFADEHITGRPLTMPGPPDLPPDEVTG
ncbi:MAG: glutathione S-transferase family protein [Paracoccaceae bacterium]